MYPAAPWHLNGHGVQTVHLVSIASLRDQLPPELSIVSVLPGKTLGVVAFAHYGPGSVLEYDELIVAPALVRHQGKIGVWVSHIYVDNPVSVRGGREIWGVPKELAEFSWKDDGATGEVTAWRNGKRLATTTMQRRWWLGRKKMNFPTFSQHGEDLVRFVGSTEGVIGWGRSRVDIPQESSFADLEIGKPRLSLWVKEMTLICGAPQVVGPTSFATNADQLMPQPATMSGIADG